MCNRNSPDGEKEKKATMECVRETPQAKKLTPRGICKRNSPDKNKARMGCLRETPHIKKT